MYNILLEIKTFRICINWRGEYIFDGTQVKSKNCAFSVKNKQKFVSALCVGTIYCNVHVLTDGRLNFHKEYHRYMQKCSTM